MKKLMNLMAPLSLIAAALTFGACQQSGKENNDVSYDSVRISIEQNDTVSINAQFPAEGNDCFRHAVLERLSEELGGSYAGSYDSARVMLQHYADSYMQQMKKADMETIEAGGKPMPEARRFGFRKVYDTAKLTSFELRQYVYNGGSYESTLGFTVRKSDGRVIDQHILNTLFRTDEQVRDWDKALKQALQKEWKLSGTAELAAQLYSKDGSVALPQTPPYFTAEGLVLRYQPGEIAERGAKVVIPYGKVEEFLNETGKKLIENKKLKN